MSRAGFVRAERERPDDPQVRHSATSRDLSDPIIDAGGFRRPRQILHATPPAVQIRSMPVPLILHLPDLTATEALGERLASIARPGDCILLEGPLGAGKTALARAFLRAAAADPALEVPSPSFTLVQIYDTQVGPVFHYDLWRLDAPRSLAELDWEDALDAIVLVEWPDRLGPLRPPDALTVALQLGENEARQATLTGWNDRLSSGPGA
jgi:tRNA threonylcarbamoyladenosine biosynthesis protein TsaE